MISWFAAEYVEGESEDEFAYEEVGLWLNGRTLMFGVIVSSHHVYGRCQWMSLRSLQVV